MFSTLGQDADTPKQGAYAGGMDKAGNCPAFPSPRKQENNGLSGEELCYTNVRDTKTFLHKGLCSAGEPKLLKWGLPGRGSNLLKSRRPLMPLLSPGGVLVGCVCSCSWEEKLFSSAKAFLPGRSAEKDQRKHLRVSVRASSSGQLGSFKFRDRSTGGLCSSPSQPVPFRVIAGPRAKQKRRIQDYTQGILLLNNWATQQRNKQIACH